MMSIFLRHRWALLLIAAAALVALFASDTLLRRARLDLTANGLYTIAPSTEELLANLSEPVTVDLFFSDQASRDLPHLRNYYTRIRELIEEMAILANGRLTLNTHDPKPFSEEEDKAVGFGLRKVRSAAKADLYFGLAATGKSGGREVIATFSTERETFLEYDLARALYNASQPSKPKLGLISTLPINGSYDLAQRSTPGWAVLTQLSSSFDIIDYGLEPDRLDEDLSSLLVVHPQDLTSPTLYLIDQFALRGGRVLLFADPMAETQLEANPRAQAASNPEALLRAWGLSMPPEQFVVDRASALVVRTSDGGSIRHPGILSLKGNRINRDDVITTKLNNIHASSAGALIPLAGGETEMVPLLSTSGKAVLTPVGNFRVLATSEGIDTINFTDPRRYAIAARVSGPAKSLFSAPPQELLDRLKEAADNGEAEIELPPHLDQAVDSGIKVLVSGDTDLLTNRLWVRVLQFLGQNIPQPFADNGSFFANIVDNFSGSSALIGIRGRERFSRPFSVVEELQKEAEDRYRQVENDLRKRLKDTEKKLNDLQRERDDPEKGELSPQQQKTLNEFKSQRLMIRRELREVRFNLNRDIESLGATLKAINIGGVPLLLALIALGSLATRNMRRRRAS